MTIFSRAEQSAADTWNLNSLYDSPQAWEKDFAELEQDYLALPRFQGTLGESAEKLKDAVEVYLRIGRVLDKVYTYAHLLSDEDTANGGNLGLLERVMNLASRISTVSSYFTPELIAIDDKVLSGFLDRPDLNEYRRMIDDIVRYKPHTLSTAEETLLAAGSEVHGACSRIFSQLNNADLEFGSIEVDGKEHALTHGSYHQYLRDPRRDVRVKAFDKYYKGFDSHRHTLASTLAGSVRKDVYLAKVRNHSSALESALFGDNVKESVYTNLVETVSKNLAPLHKYYEIRKQVLKLEPLHILDTYVPLVAEIKTKIPYDEAAKLVWESLQPLGSEYVDVLRSGLTNERWVDRYENKGKRSGAYSSGCYDSVPYILMNYKEETLNDVFTLAHEAGHSMHSYFSCKTQPYQDHGYTIFVAEVASTFNEQLLLRHLRHIHRDDPRMLVYLINHQIDEIKSTLYRQTMFAEFERITHGLCEQNAPLTVDVFREAYRGLLEKYFGAAISLREMDDLECFRIPHFYSAFYVYKYATGISAAISLTKRVLNGGPKELDAYLTFLKSGGSKYPLDLLAGAGVRLDTPEPIEAAMQLFTELVDELEEGLKRV